jgi:hypothetical protein
MRTIVWSKCRNIWWAAVYSGNCLAGVRQIHAGMVIEMAAVRIEKSLI